MIFVQNKKLLIRSMEKKDINKSFVKSLNNNKLNKFLLSGEKKQSLRLAIKYFHYMNKNKHLYLCVIDKLENKFVGTITYRKINKKNYYLGFMISNIKYLGNIVFYDAVKMSLKYLIKKYNIKKILAGTSKKNIASNFFLMKLGFVLKDKTKKTFNFEIKKI
jgi:RimJ/RimL family protein N-acetyltransferase